MTDQTPGGQGGRTGDLPAGDKEPRTVLMTEHIRPDGVLIRLSVVVHGNLPPDAQMMLDQLIEDLEGLR